MALDLSSPGHSGFPSAADGEPAPPPVPAAPHPETTDMAITPSSAIEAAPLAPPREVPPSPASADRWRAVLTSFGASLALHLALLLVFSITMFAVSGGIADFALTILPRASSDEEPLTIVELPEETYILPGDVLPEIEEGFERAAEIELPNVRDEVAGEPEPSGDAHLAPADGHLRPEQLLQRRPGQGGGLEGRSDEVRAILIGQRGGSVASENAVANGLAWLAAHQRNGGGWHFDHRGEACADLCENPGTAGTTTGATALALLPFLGAGHTHLQGEHREVVQQGLYYLQSRVRRTPQGGDYLEGTMYAQGLTAIALCEAYAMTKDPDLRPFAQDAINYICYAQHTAGGWRYFPGQPGDTTVFGWQFMALKSAALAKLEVPSPVIDLAERYLDSVQSEQGAAYGYLKTGKDPTPTAVGLLSRMYLGWPQDKPELERGATYLARLGPSREDMYFNYYATQVLHHHDGPAWEKWNPELRDYLVKTQAKGGHQRGSWFFPDKHGLAGGRLYTTAMCVMILEVYYRHMPLYGERTVTEGF